MNIALRCVHPIAQEFVRCGTIAKALVDGLLESFNPQFDPCSIEVKPTSRVSFWTKELVECGVVEHTVWREMDINEDIDYYSMMLCDGVWTFVPNLITLPNSPYHPYTVTVAEALVQLGLATQPTHAECASHVATRAMERFGYVQ